MNREYSLLDRLIMEVDEGISTLFGNVAANRPSPADDYPEETLTDEEKKHSGGYMRVDHTGEVCAQALYRAQMLVSRSQSTQNMLAEACEEEKDHLAWTSQRLHELDDHRSYMNVYWYLHSFFIGVFAGVWGDRWSLGFVEETERQVSRHLTHHINDLPTSDIRSRKIVEKMREDEERHGENAMIAGGSPLPSVIKKLMTVQAKVMTTLAYYI